MLQPIGSGAFGDVYLAQDKELKRPVALKIYRPREGEHGVIGTRAPGDVLKEGRLMARVNHPNVLRVYGAAHVDGQVGIWMELVQGRTLQEMIETQGVFGAEEAKAVGREVCQALAAVHAAGLLHRDIKASNVMRAEGGRFLLMDFGVGAEVREEAGVRARSGTPAYMAPETAREGISTVASDIYSVGVLLFHLVTGCYPGDPVPAQATVRVARAAQCQHR